MAGATGARSRRGQRRELVTPETPYRVGLEVHYYREVQDEPPIPFDEVVLHADADLLVADKPHFCRSRPPVSMSTKPCWGA
jgi:23S rRNA-/tRNA-specific pseudouridylate synthase